MFPTPFAYQVINDWPLGRNIDEMLLLVDGLSFNQQHGEVCPAGWQQGKPVMETSPESEAKYLAEGTDVL